MGDAALCMLATRMTLLNRMASFRIRTIAAELRPTEATQTRNPSVLIANGINLGLRRPTRSWRLEAPPPGGNNEERAAVMKAYPNANKTKPGKGGGALIAAPQGEPQFALRMK
jgi:hypothetical protein